MIRAALIASSLVPLLVNAHAMATTITFDELPLQAVGGVSFGFKIAGADSNDAFYASYGPGNLSTVSAPSLTGNSTGILTLDFDIPTPALEFGAALSTAESLSPGFTVELFDDSAQSLGTFAVDTTAVGGAIAFPEATFTYSGTAVTKAIINFAGAPGNFAFDNLIIIPEPSSFVPCCLAILLAFRSVRWKPCASPPIIFAPRISRLTGGH